MNRRLLSSYQPGSCRRAAPLLPSKAVKSLFLRNGFVVAAVLLSPPDSHAREIRETPDPPLALVTRSYGAGSDRPSGYVAEFTRVALERERTQPLLDLARSLGDSGVNAALKDLKTAEKLVRRGRRFFLNEFRLKSAVETLNSALRLFDRKAAYLTDFAPVSDALLLLGAIHLLQESNQLAEERIAQALNVNPHLEPDPEYYNESMRRFFDRVRRRVSQNRNGSLLVETEPPGARLYLDGKFVGISPETIVELPRGRHYLRALKDGYGSFGKVVDIQGAISVADRVVLPRTKAFADFDRLCDQIFERLNRGESTRQLETLFGQLATLLNVDDILMQEVRIDGEQVRLFAARMSLSGTLRSKVDEIRFAYDAKGQSYAQRVSDFVMKLIVLNQVRNAGLTDMRGAIKSVPGLPSTDTCAGMPCDEFRSQFLLIGGASALGLAGLGTVFGLLANSDNNDFRETPQASPDSSDLESSGQTKAVVADILLGTAVITALTSLGVYLFYHPSTTAEEVLETRFTGGLGFLPTQDRGGLFMGSWKF